MIVKTETTLNDVTLTLEDGRVVRLGVLDNDIIISTACNDLETPIQVVKEAANVVRIKGFKPRQDR